MADALPFLRTQPGRFELIVAVDVFEHFTRDELIPLVPAIHAALRPGGILLVQTANGQGLFPNQVIYGDLTHLTIFTPGSLGHLLRRSGFGQLALRRDRPGAVRLRGQLDSMAWWAIRLLASFVRQVETGKRQTIWTENFRLPRRARGSARLEPALIPLDQVPQRPQPKGVVDATAALLGEHLPHEAACRSARARGARPGSPPRRAPAAAA